MSSIRRAIIVSLILSLSAAVAFGAPEKIQPKIKMQIGQKFKLKISSDSKTLMTVQGQSQEITDSAALGCTFCLGTIDNVGDMTFRVTYDSLRINEEAPAGKLTYDSTSTAEVPPLVRGFAALIGQSFAMKMSPDGRIRSVTGADEMVQKGIEKCNILSEPWKSSMMKVLTDRFGNLPTLEMFQGVFGIYPEQPVAVGERWSRKFEQSQSTVEGFYKILDRTNGNLTIKAYCTSAPNPDSPPIQIGLASMRSDLRATEDGTIVIEEATGIIEHMKMTETSSGNLMLITGDSEIPIPTSVKVIMAIDKM